MRGDRRQCHVDGDVERRERGAGRLLPSRRLDGAGIETPQSEVLAGTSSRPRLLGAPALWPGSSRWRRRAPRRSEKPQACCAHAVIAFSKSFTTAGAPVVRVGEMTLCMGILILAGSAAGSAARLSKNTAGDTQHPRSTAMVAAPPRQARDADPRLSPADAVAPRCPGRRADKSRGPLIMRLASSSCVTRPL